MTDEQGSGQVSWNSAQFLISEISNLRSRANTFRLQRDYGNAFECLRCVKATTIQSFSKEEREQLRKKEMEFSECLQFQKMVRPKGFGSDLTFPGEVEQDKTGKMKAEMLRKIKNIIPLYEEYNELLADLLEKYGYLIPVKEDASKMKF